MRRGAVNGAKIPRLVDIEWVREVRALDFASPDGLEQRLRSMVTLELKHPLKQACPHRDWMPWGLTVDRSDGLVAWSQPVEYGVNRRDGHAGLIAEQEHGHVGVRYRAKAAAQ
jgi:hypothetical protein